MPIVKSTDRNGSRVEGAPHTATISLILDRSEPGQGPRLHRHPCADMFVVVRDVPIAGQMIRLGQLLKLASVIDSGSEVKAFLATEPVWVNGQREARRGRQLYLGDLIRVGEQELRLIADRPE